MSALNSPLRFSKDAHNHRDFQFTAELPSGIHGRMIMNANAILGAFEQCFCETLFKLGDIISFTADSACNVKLQLEGKPAPVGEIKIFCSDISIPSVVQWTLDLKELTGDTGSFLAYQNAFEKLEAGMEKFGRNVQRPDGGFGSKASFMYTIDFNDLAAVSEIFMLIQSLAESPSEFI